MGRQLWGMRSTRSKRRYSRPSTLIDRSNMPWEQPLNQILQSVEGPVAKIIAVIIIIIVTGLSLAFGDTSGGFRRLIQIDQSSRSQR
jgi:TrbC/VIRB2 pilin